MKQKQYRQIRVAIIIFVAAMLAIALNLDSYLLAAMALITGIILSVAIKSRVKFKVDEREIAIREKVAQLTYAIFTPTIGIGAFLLLFPAKSGLSVFSKGEWLFVEALGLVLAYLTLFLIMLYAISYYFLGKKYGGNAKDEK